MITFPVLFINLSSILLICTVMLAIWRSRAKTAGHQLMVASLFMFIWAIGSFGEMAAHALPTKVVWRNFTQIGVFFTPVASLLFAIAYTGLGNTFRKNIARISYTFQGIGILLVATDHWHHLIRSRITLVRTPLYETLIVETTTLANFLISCNFFFLVAAIGLIGFHALTTTTNTRKQVSSVLFGMVIALAYSMVKVVTSERFAQLVPISGIFALSALFMLLGLLRFDLLRIPPLAREQVFKFVGEGIIIAGPDGSVLDTNPAALRMFGATVKTMEVTMRSNIPQLFEALRNQTYQSFSFYHENTYLQCDIYPIKDKRAIDVGTITIVKDNTEEKQKSDLLQYRAERDGLTGLYNRQTFIDLVELRLKENRGPMCLIFFDIDHFKLVNDQFGHMAGDIVLRSISEQTVRRLGPLDLAGRMGGEEFAIYRPHAHHDEAIAWAERLRADIANTEFTFAGTPFHSSVSIGICFSEHEGFDAVYRVADEQAYIAKAAGRNCIRYLVRN